MTVQSKDISIVLQGPIRPDTPESVRKCRLLLPDAEIILATWKGEQVETVTGADRIIEIEDIPPAFVQHKRLGVRNNLNRMIRSSKVGIGFASRPYILKMRSDLMLDSTAFLDTFELYPAQGPKTVLTHKVLVPLLFSRTAYKGKRTPFHLSDWAAFGLAEDIRKIFQQTDEVKEPEFTEWFSKSKPGPFGSTTFRMAPEQWIFHSFFGRHFPKIMNDAADNGDIAGCLSDEFIVSNFIVADYSRSGFRLPKYKASTDETLIGAEFLELWNAFIYENLYRQFCDRNYASKRKEIENYYINKETFISKFRLRKHMTSLREDNRMSKKLEEILVIPIIFTSFIINHLTKR